MQILIVLPEAPWTTWSGGQDWLDEEEDEEDKLEMTPPANMWLGPLVWTRD